MKSYWYTLRILGAVFLAVLIYIGFGYIGFGNRQARADEDALYAIEFDGVDDNVQIGYALDIMGMGWTQTKTVNVWVLPTRAGRPCCSPSSPNYPNCAFQAVGQCDAIFGDSPTWWGISVGSVFGTDRIWIHNTYPGPPPGNPRFSSIGIPYTVGEWVNIALVHDHTILRAYKNGDLIGTVTNSGSTMQPTTGALPKLSFGAINDSSTIWPFQGQIDELRLWNYPLTEAEIEANMYNALVGDEPGLMAYYQMLPGPPATVVSDDALNSSWDGVMADGWVNPPLGGDGTLPQWVDSDAFVVPATATPTNTTAPTDTQTPTPTSTSTASPTPTQTSTATTTLTQTSTATSTSTTTPTSTSTATLTPTATTTSTPTATTSPTATSSSTATATEESGVTLQNPIFLPIISNP